MNRFLYALLTICCISGVPADEITTTSGNVIRDTVIAQTDRFLVLDTGSIPASLPWTEIATRSRATDTIADTGKPVEARPATTAPTDTTSLAAIAPLPYTDTKDSLTQVTSKSPVGKITPTLRKDKVGISYYKKEASDTNRVSWIEKGGRMSSMNIGACYTYLQIKQEGTSLVMNGGGYDFTQTLLFLIPPDADAHRGWWGAFNIGLGSNGSFTTGTSEIDFGFGLDPMTMTLQRFSEAVSIPLGATLGIGGFSARRDWRGIALTLSYVPALQYTLQSMIVKGPQKTTTITNSLVLNLGGMNAALDFGSFGKTSSKLAREAHFSLFGYFFPKTSKTPMMFSVGLSLLMYKQARQKGGRS